MSDDLTIFNRKTLNSKKYWTDMISNITEVSSFPHDFEKKENSQGKETFNMPVPQEICRTLLKISNGSDFLTYAILMAALQVTLYQYHCREYVCVGSPSRIGQSNATNTLPVILKINESKSFKTILLEARDMLEDAYRYQDFAFNQLSDDKTGHFKYDSLFSVVLVHPLLHSDVPNAYQDITITIQTLNENLELVWEYSAYTYNTYSIKRFNENLLSILGQAMKELSAEIGHFELVSNTDERKNLLINCQGEKAEFPQNKPVISLFEEQCLTFPNKTALVCQHGQLTYSELSEKIDRLAGLLLEKGVKSADRIAIYATRSLETIIGIYAICKLGASYIPIEPSYPTARVNYIIENSGAKFILLPDNDTAKTSFGIPEINIGINSINHMVLNNLPVKQDVHAPCYIIYTSGTTGKPKGVEISNRELLNLCWWFKESHSVNSDSIILLLNAFGFDASVKNVFTPLICGGTLVLGPQNLFDTPEVLKIITKYNVTHINCVPSLFYALVDTDQVNQYSNLLKLKYVTLGGEALRSAPLVPWVESEDFNCIISNVYGPTECTSVSTAYFLSKEDILSRKEIPIGKPVYNKFVYVLNKNKKLCPVGIPGELYISGIGTTREYILNEEYTKASFFSDPFTKDYIMYKTGDLVKWTEDENLVFIGRTDFQVKVQGHRIELGEIESIINSYPKVQNSIVTTVTDPNGNYRLAAYVQYTKNEPFNEQQFRDYLLEWLPEYMVPSLFKICESFPLTPHGKIDRKSLPPIGSKTSSSDSQSGESLSSLQNSMVEIWKSVLGINKVSINDNFFDVGGYSLLLYKLSRKIEEQLKISVTFLDLLTYPTIQSFVEYVESMNKDSATKIDSSDTAENTAALRLSRISKRKEMFSQRKLTVED